MERTGYAGIGVGGTPEADPWGKHTKTLRASTGEILRGPGSESG